MRAAASAGEVVLVLVLLMTSPATRGAPAPGPAVTAEAPYPRRFDLRTVNAWLRRAVGPSAGGAALLTARSAFVRAPRGGRGRLVLRQEALTPAAAAALGGRSALVVLGLDCQGRSSWPERVEVHTAPGLGGGGRDLDPALWARLDPEVEAEDFVLLACGPAREARPLGETPTEPPVRGAKAAPKSPGSLEVQIGAFAAEAGADAAFRAVRRALPAETAGLAVRLAPAGMGGRLRRALVGPFAGRLDADAFCAKAHARGLACLVRRDAPWRETAAPWPDGTSKARSTSPISPPTPPATSP